MALAEGLATYIELFRAAPPLADLAAARLAGDLGAGRFAAGEQFADITRCDTWIVAEGREIAVRLYTPEVRTTRGAICHFHGGGFSHGSVATFDLVGAALAQASGTLVASVEYRRLPDSGQARHLWEWGW